MLFPFSLDVLPTPCSGWEDPLCAPLQGPAPQGGIRRGLQAAWTLRRVPGRLSRKGRLSPGEVDKLSYSYSRAVRPVRSRVVTMWQGTRLLSAGIHPSSTVTGGSWRSTGSHSEGTGTWGCKERMLDPLAGS